MNIDQLSHKENILVKAARKHNLKGIDVAIPRNTFTVITGVSGSGKSTLAFDTLYAEGQRRYVESLSAYARQFLDRLDKPEADYIKGISPAIAIEQKVVSTNSRSTVGTSTEIYDYLKILFARLGKIYSPKTGKEIKQQTIDDIHEELLQHENEKGLIYVPSEFHSEKAEDLIAQGFSRVRIKGDILDLADIEGKSSDFDLIIDRFVVSDDSDFESLIKESVEVSYEFTDGFCFIDLYKGNTIQTTKYSKFLEEDGVVFEEPSIELFNYNSPAGACRTCEGFGNVLGLSEDLIIPEKSLSVHGGAVAPWRTKNQLKWKYNFINNAHDFPIHRPYKDLSEAERDVLWNGDGVVKGINQFFEHKQKKIYKIQNRVLLSKYKGKTACPDCGGHRLRKEAQWIKIGGKSIAEVDSMTIQEVALWLESLIFNEREKAIAKRVLEEITNRISFLIKVGVPYMTLNRSSGSLSGGESQRINLASSIGSALVGALYILDEPSIGLHPRDTKKLIQVLEELNEVGNTVVVVEHDEDIIKAAQYVVDIGPFAGSEGGEVVFQGTSQDLLKSSTLTSDYIHGKKEVKIKRDRRVTKKTIGIVDAYKFNLKVDKFSFPLNSLVAVVGVSGSGKSTLLLEEFVPELRRYIDYDEKGRLTGDVDLIEEIEYVDQNPIGRSSRSNPVTYVKAYDDIRSLFASSPMSQLRAYKPGFFSLNVPGGRCEECQGEGVISVEMQFMADLKIKCTECKGKKFKDEILEVEVNGKNISQVLDLTVSDAIQFFDEVKTQSRTIQKLILKLKALEEVGLSYVKLGQASSTLSGGEAQRVKLAYFLIKGNTSKKTLFVFDEPTTGLHFHDVNQLLNSFAKLLELGHSVVVIEHNADVVKNSDYVIELGPEGGDKGGQIVYAGMNDGFELS